MPDVTCLRAGLMQVRRPTVLPTAYQQGKLSSCQGLRSRQTAIRAAGNDNNASQKKDSTPVSPSALAYPPHEVQLVHLVSSATLHHHPLSGHHCTSSMHINRQPSHLALRVAVRLHTEGCDLVGGGHSGLWVRAVLWAASSRLRCAGCGQHCADLCLSRDRRWLHLNLHLQGSEQGVPLHGPAMMLSLAPGKI